MQGWYGGKDGVNISQKATTGLGINESRYHSDEYDPMYDRCHDQPIRREATALFIAMNDHLINNVVIMAEVARAAEKYAIINS